MSEMMASRFMSASSPGSTVETACVLQRRRLAGGGGQPMLPAYPPHMFVPLPLDLLYRNRPFGVAKVRFRNRLFRRISVFHGFRATRCAHRALLPLIQRCGLVHIALYDGMPRGVTAKCAIQSMPRLCQFILWLVLDNEAVTSRREPEPAWRLTGRPVARRPSTPPPRVWRQALRSATAPCDRRDRRHHRDRQPAAVVPSAA